MNFHPDIECRMKNTLLIEYEETNNNNTASALLRRNQRWNDFFENMDLTHCIW